MSITQYTILSDLDERLITADIAGKNVTADIENRQITADIAPLEITGNLFNRNIITSVFGRTGVINAKNSDYNWVQIQGGFESDDFEIVNGKLTIKDSGITLAHNDLSDMPSASNSNHDGRYYTETEIDTMLNDGTIEHDNTSGITANNHHNEEHTIVSHDTETTGAQLTSLYDGSEVNAVHKHDNRYFTETEVNNNFLKLDQTTPQTVSNGKPNFEEGIQIAGVGLNDTTSGSPGCSLVGISGIDTPTWTTQCHFNSLFGSAGRATGGVISDNGGGTVAVTAGTGFIKANDTDTDELLSFDWAENNSMSITNAVTWIGVRYAGGSPELFQDTSIYNFDLDTEFPLGAVYRETVNGSYSYCVMNSPWWVTDGMTNILERIYSGGKVFVDKAIGGMAISNPATTKLAVTTGKLWVLLNEFDMTAIDTSVPTGSFWYMYYKSVDGWTLNATATDYSVTQWNDTTQNALQNLSNNKYANIWVYACPGVDRFVLIYPQAQHNTSATAEAEAPPTLIPTPLAEDGVLIGRLIIQEGVDAPIEIQSALDTVFTPSQASVHGNLAGLLEDDHTHYALLDGRSGDTLKIDDITEHTTDHGVDIEGVNLKDGIINGSAKYGDANNYFTVVPYTDGLPNVGWAELQFVGAGTWTPALGSIKDALYVRGSGATSVLYLSNSDVSKILKFEMDTATGGLTFTNSASAGTTWEDDFTVDGDLEVTGGTYLKDKLYFTQSDGNEYIDSLNDGYLDIGATTAVRVKSPLLAEDKIYFTQTDGNEYIDSLADGYLDIDATTAIRLKALALAEDKITFTQTDGNEYIDSLADGYMDYGATTEHRFNADVNIDGDLDIDSLTLESGATISSSGDIDVSCDILDVSASKFVVDVVTTIPAVGDLEEGQMVFYYAVGGTWRLYTKLYSTLIWFDGVDK